MHEEENPESQLIRKYSRLSLLTEALYEIIAESKRIHAAPKVVSVVDINTTVSRKWYISLNKSTILRLYGFQFIFNTDGVVI